jgi:preprotein translocase subunit SecG
VTLAIKIVLALLIVLALVVAVLRIRKLRRDEHHDSPTKIDRSLLTPPPSPYSPSKGFRLLDGSYSDAPHAAPPRPRLEPDHEYVFSDTQLPPYDVRNLSHLRHDEHWALSRAARRARFSLAGMRTLIVIAVVIIALGIAVFYFSHPGKSKGSTTTTTTTAPGSSSGSPGEARLFVLAAPGRAPIIFWLS